MAVTGTKTVLDICTSALRKIGVQAVDETPTADDLNVAISALNMMLKGWQNRGWLTWTYTRASLALTTDASYTLAPVRPIRIVNARFRRGGIETPMQEMTRDEYDSLPLKTSQGIPTTFYFDRQREASLFYVWPVLAAATGQTIEYTYEREIEDKTIGSDVLDLPGEWWEAAVYQLALRLADDYMVTVTQTLFDRAERALDEALAHDREGSLWFGDY